MVGVSVGELGGESGELLRAELGKQCVDRDVDGSELGGIHAILACALGILVKLGVVEHLADARHREQPDRLGVGWGSELRLEELRESAIDFVRLACDDIGKGERLAAALGGIGFRDGSLGCGHGYSYCL